MPDLPPGDARTVHAALFDLGVPGVAVVDVVQRLDESLGAGIGGDSTGGVVGQQGAGLGPAAGVGRQDAAVGVSGHLGSIEGAPAGEDAGEAEAQQGEGTWWAFHRTSILPGPCWSVGSFRVPSRAPG